MREGDRPNHGPDISPSNRENLPLREALERSFSSANFPPLDPQIEGPSTRDIHLSNADIQAIAAEVSKKQKTGRTLLAGMIIGGGLVAGGFYAREVFAEEPISEPTPASRGIDTVPGGTSFTDDRLVDDRLVPRTETKKVNPEEVVDNRPTIPTVVPAETKKVNPEEIFNKTSTEENFTDANSVTMTPEQYQETSPRLVNNDSVVIPLPIEYPEGQTPNVKFKREKGMFGGKRLINGKLENRKIVSDGTVTVNDVFIIDGVPVGSVLLAPFDGEIEFSTSSGYEQHDGSLSLAAFLLYSKDSKGNTITLTFSTVKFKPLIEPSRIEYEEGTNHTKPTPRQPIKAGDPIGTILTTRHDNPHYDGQIHISALSSVEESGQRRGGAAGIEIATTPEGQGIRLDRNSDQG